MKKKISCLLIGLLILTSCSNIRTVSNHALQEENEQGLNKKDAIPATFFPDPIEIVSLGDSLTQGVGDTTDKGGLLAIFATSARKRTNYYVCEFCQSWRKRQSN